MADAKHNQVPQGNIVPNPVPGVTHAPHPDYQHMDWVPAVATGPRNATLLAFFGTIGGAMLGVGLASLSTSRNEAAIRAIAEKCVDGTACDALEIHTGTDVGYLVCGGILVLAQLAYSVWVLRTIKRSKPPPR